MSTEILTQTLQPGVPAKFGAGTMFLIVALTGTVNVSAQQIGNSNKNRTFAGVPAGFKFTADSPDDGFDTLTVTSASGDTIQIAVGSDDVTFANTVTVSNIVGTKDTPAGALTDTAPISCLIGALTPVVPQNLSRRRVTLSVDPAAVGTVYARAAGGGNNLMPMMPGLSYQFAGTYGVSVRNDTGAAVNVYILEES